MRRPTPPTYIARGPCFDIFLPTFGNGSVLPLAAARQTVEMPPPARDERSVFAKVETDRGVKIRQRRALDPWPDAKWSQVASARFHCGATVRGSVPSKRLPARAHPSC